ncbi:MAG: hypothetical protein ACOYN0_18220 [Phycisphaerales bacterium]
MDELFAASLIDRSGPAKLLTVDLRLLTIGPELLTIAPELLTFLSSDRPNTLSGPERDHAPVAKWEPG